MTTAPAPVLDDYEIAPLEPTTRAELDAFEAAIWFLMVGRDGPRYIKALTVHVPGVELPCLGGCPRWPCINWLLARESRDRHLGLPVDLPRPR